MNVSSIQAPMIAGERPNDREHIDHEGYRSPSLIIRYSITGWCLARYRLLGQTGQTDVQQLRRLTEIVQAQERRQATPSDDAAADRIRAAVLDDFVAFVLRSPEAFADQISHIALSGTSAMLYSVARALPDSFPEPRDLLPFSSWDFIEGFLQTYSDFAADQYDLSAFTEALMETMRVYFKRLQAGLKDGSIRLDPRYRRHFRASVMRACDQIRDDLGEAFWREMFPPRSDDLPETRAYDLSREPPVYDWDVDVGLPADNRLVMRQPYAPILDAHQVAKLKVALSALDAIQRVNNRRDGVTQDHLIALMICYPGPAEGERLLQKWGLSSQEIMQIMVHAHADRTAICHLACGGHDDDGDDFRHDGDDHESDDDDDDDDDGDRGNNDWDGDNDQQNAQGSAAEGRHADGPGDHPRV